MTLFVAEIDKSIMKINKRQKELLETEAVAVGTLNKDGEERKLILSV